MYRTFAFDLVTTRARKELEADAQKLLLYVAGMGCTCCMMNRYGVDITG
jgi:hypothetical protein